MAAATPSRPYRCWDCRSFQIEDTTTKNGDCRNLAPVVINDIPGGAIVSMWPVIADGTEEWCSQYKRATGNIPTEP